VEMWYALKNPCYFTRTWRDVECVKTGNFWVGQMPVANVDDYVFGFANINYDTTVVVSTDFNAAIPSKLGNAKATDKTSNVVYSGDGGIGACNNVSEVEWEVPGTFDVEMQLRDLSLQVTTHPESK